MNRNNNTWVNNMCQKLEDICTDIDKLVCKEPVAFVGNQMEAVGANVKNFFSGFVDDFGLTRVVDLDPVRIAQALPSTCIDLVESSTNSVAETKENAVGSDTNNPKEAPLTVNELRHKSSSTGSHDSEQITSEISHLIGEKDRLINETSDNATQVDLNSSTKGENLDNRFEEDVVYDECLHSDAIDNIIHLNLDINNIIEGVQLMNLEEKKTLLNIPIDELECDSDTTETMDYFSVSSDTLSSYGSFSTIDCDSNNEAYASCSETGSADGSMEDFEDVNYDAAESSVISAGGKLSLCPNTPRSKSYKKMIQDVFKSRKRLTKEYKQLAILHRDIDKEVCQPTAKDLPDSEWELL